MAAANARDESVWIGAHDLEVEGEFIWIDGSRANDVDMHWNQNELNNNNDIQDCVYMLGERDGYLADDDSCFNSRLALCEKPICIQS